jgi:hypothetical protein
MKDTESALDAKHRYTAFFAVTMGVMLCLSGCQHTVETASSYPPDFALRVSVEGPVEPSRPAFRSAQHIIEPSRKLRVMLGAGVDASLYPPPTATLTHEQMQKLYQAASQAIDAEYGGSGPSRVDPESSRVAIRLIANGREVQTVRIAQRNPDVIELLDLLVRLRGGR